VHSSGHVYFRYSHYQTDVDFLGVHPEDVDSLLVGFVRRPFCNLRRYIPRLLLLGLIFSNSAADPITDIIANIVNIFVVFIIVLSSKNFY
jgi:uncharacterized membrane protein